MKTLIAVLVVVVLLPNALAAQSPLAEAAAKAAAARTAPRAPVKTVYTNDDLPQGKPVAPTAAPEPLPGAPVELPTLTGASQSGTADMMKTEAYWQDRMRRAQATLDADVIAARAIEIRLANDQAASSRSERSNARGDRYLAERARDTAAELSRAKAAVQTGELAIVTLTEEARTAGVPPGWLRLGPR